MNDVCQSFVLKTNTLISLKNIDLRTKHHETMKDKISTLVIYIKYFVTVTTIIILTFSL